MLFRMSNSEKNEQQQQQQQEYIVKALKDSYIHTELRNMHINNICLMNVLMYLLNLQLKKKETKERSDNYNNKSNRKSSSNNKKNIIHQEQHYKVTTIYRQVYEYEKW